MNCPSCWGRGWEPIVIYRSRGEVVGTDGRRPCQECRGTGKVHCCEGDSACNEQDVEDDDER